MSDSLEVGAARNADHSSLLPGAPSVKRDFFNLLLHFLDQATVNSYFFRVRLIRNLVGEDLNGPIDSGLISHKLQAASNRVRHSGFFEQVRWIWRVPVRRQLFIVFWFLLWTRLLRHSGKGIEIWIAILYSHIYVRFWTLETRIESELAAKHISRSSGLRATLNVRRWGSLRHLN